ncbi:hypothetical protein COV13_02765 [Candidatus Woesearchaeota archaeon CG10_big_fil_rev_8_21_14_0_10_32_9]|nr:MAG: hypothetical protein COV13_02765 [Candidatus Woesearchaeota archaeon CG10_big_fil_rev_8_21_14_0_10_32_9]
MDIKNWLAVGMLSLPLVLGSCKNDPDEQLIADLKEHKYSYSKIDVLEDSLKSRIFENILHLTRNHNVVATPYESFYKSDDTTQAELYARNIVFMNTFSEAADYLKTLKSLNSDLYGVEPTLKKHLELISLRELSTAESVRDFYFTAGQVDVQDTNKISLDPDDYSKGTLVHELGHLYANHLDSCFFNEWNKLVDTTGYKRHNIVEDFPSDGFIREYGSKGPHRHVSFNGQSRWHEDIATYVEEAYAEDFGNFRFVDTTDKRYDSKLNLLRKEGFLSDKKYSEIKKVLGKDFVY